MNSNIIHHLQNAYSEGLKIDMAYLRALAKERGVPLAKAAGIASFYAAFNSELETESYDFSGYTDRAPEPDGDYSALDKALAAPEAIIDIIEKARLKGRSGSGFPVADKWRITKSAEADMKYVVCNGSEGEGETYKDLVLLTKAPHAIIEGMAISAVAVGAKIGFIYVRYEYNEAYESVKNALIEAYERGILGNGFEILVRRGAGAYVCGEETALMEFLEGKRGEPRLKPPYPGVWGLYGKPTVINNVETFASIPAIILGSNDGEKRLYTVTGCVKKPGVYECDCSTTIAELFKKADGKSFKGLRIGGGASGAIVSAKVADIALSIEDCAKAGINLGTASLMFFDDSVSAVEVCGQSLMFLSEQSCGKCAPCRLGTKRACVLLDKIKSGSGRACDIDELKELASYMQESSRCGLGSAAATPILTALEHFGEEFEALCGSVR